MTVEKLKAWLADKPDNFEIELMIEVLHPIHSPTVIQYQMPMQDMALTNDRIVFIHEAEDL
jgi:hypothetical protein